MHQAPRPIEDNRRVLRATPQAGAGRAVLHLDIGGIDVTISARYRHCRCGRIHQRRKLVSEAVPVRLARLCVDVVRQRRRLVLASAV